MCELGCVRAEVHTGSGIAQRAARLASSLPGWWTIKDDRGVASVEQVPNGPLYRPLAACRVVHGHPDLTLPVSVPAGAGHLRPIRSNPPEPGRAARTGRRARTRPSRCIASADPAAGRAEVLGTLRGRDLADPAASSSFPSVQVASSWFPPDQAHKIATFDRERRGFLPGEGWQ
jgi:hypothetical protein